MEGVGELMVCYAVQLQLQAHEPPEPDNTSPPSSAVNLSPLHTSLNAIVIYTIMPGRTRGAKVVQVLVAVILPPLLLSIVFASRLLMIPPSTSEHPLPEGPYPGDDVIPDANMVYDQVRWCNTTSNSVWPWVLQLGKGRAGWYTPASWEKYLPESWHALKEINPDWQNLKVGDRVEDYGFSADDHFIVSDLQRYRALVYKSDRYGARFSWSIILHDIEARRNPWLHISEQPTDTTLIHLRFRGKIAATGYWRKMIVWAGGKLDHWTTAPMLAGLAERAEENADFCGKRCPQDPKYWCRRVCDSYEARSYNFKPYKVMDWGDGWWGKGDKK